MTAWRKLLLAATVVTFILAKVYFVFKTPKALGLAAIPAFILILSTPATAKAQEVDGKFL